MTNPPLDGLGCQDTHLLNLWSQEPLVGPRLLQWGLGLHNLLLFCLDLQKRGSVPSGPAPGLTVNSLLPLCPQRAQLNQPQVPTDTCSPSQGAREPTLTSHSGQDKVRPRGPRYVTCSSQTRPPVPLTSFLD